MADESTKTATESFPGSNFNRADLEEFAADDAKASGNIGRMLVLFFGYSLVALIVVTTWTVWAMSE